MKKIALGVVASLLMVGAASATQTWERVPAPFDTIEAPRPTEPHEVKNRYEKAPVMGGLTRDDLDRHAGGA